MLQTADPAVVEIAGEEVVKMHETEVGIILPFAVKLINVDQLGDVDAPSRSKSSRQSLRRQADGHGEF